MFDDVEATLLLMKLRTLRIRKTIFIFVRHKNHISTFDEETTSFLKYREYQEQAL